MLVDVAIVGGGPAGLAAAIGAARRGLSVVVLEKRAFPADKACGEGLMPSGLHALERLGARALIDPSDCAAFAGIRYVQEDGSFAEARFSGEGGLGIRRVALAAALHRRAAEVGVVLRERCKVRRHARSQGRVVLDLDGGERVEARLLVGADGLASPLRHAEGLDAPPGGPRRFGLRQHFRCASWSPFVEVHFEDGVEAYVTPAGDRRVGIAFLWEDGRGADAVSFPNLLRRFPRIEERLSGAAADSEPRGAGPLARRAKARTKDQFVLLGDAGGYVDAITGEGLSLAFHCAEALTAILPEALARGATRASLRPYERAFGSAFRRYAVLSRGLLTLSRRPALRRRVVRLLGRNPRAFQAILGWVAGEHALPHDLDASGEKLLCAG